MTSHPGRKINNINQRGERKDPFLIESGSVLILMELYRPWISSNLNVMLVAVSAASLFDILPVLLVVGWREGEAQSLASFIFVWGTNVVVILKVVEHVCSAKQRGRQGLVCPPCSQCTLDLSSKTRKVSNFFFSWNTSKTVSRGGTCFPRFLYPPPSLPQPSFLVQKIVWL